MATARKTSHTWDWCSQAFLLLRWYGSKEVERRQNGCGRTVTRTLPSSGMKCSACERSWHAVTNVDT